MKKNPTSKSLELDDSSPAIDQISIELASEIQEEEPEEITPHVNSIEVAEVKTVEDREIQAMPEPQPDSSVNNGVPSAPPEIIFGNNQEPINEKDDSINQVDMAVIANQILAEDGSQVITEDLQESDQAFIQPLPSNSLSGETPSLVAKIDSSENPVPIKIGEIIPEIKDVIVFDQAVLTRESSPPANMPPPTSDNANSGNYPEADSTLDMLHHQEISNLDRTETEQPFIGEIQESGNQSSTEKPPFISTKQLQIESINMLFSADSRDDLKKSDGIVRAVMSNNGIIIGIQKEDSEGEYKSNAVNGDEAEKANTPDLAPVSTIDQLGEVINYINILTSGSQFSDKNSTENNLEDNRQKEESVTVIVTDEILDFIQLLNEDSDPDSEDINNEGLNNRTITFSTEGENPKQIVVNTEQLSQMQEILALLNETSLGNISNQVTTEENDSIIESREENGEFILGAQNHQSESEEGEIISDEINPITSIKQLAETLNLIDKLILDIGVSEFSDSEDNYDGNMNLLYFDGKFGDKNESTIIDFEIHDENEASQFTILVSEELMSFIESGNRILEKKGRNKVGNYQTLNGIHNDNKGMLIRISSTDGDILIELATLKKLIKLIEMKKKMDSVSSYKESMPAREELGLYTKPGQNSQYNVAFWFIYQTLLFLLTSADDEDLSLFYHLGPSLSPSTVIHA